MSEFEGVVESIAGAPPLTFRFKDDACKAELDGMVMSAKMTHKDRCEMNLRTAAGFLFASIEIRPRPRRSISENLMEVASALMWSHWRWTQATPEARALENTHEVTRAEPIFRPQDRICHWDPFKGVSEMEESQICDRRITPDLCSEKISDVTCLACLYTILDLVDRAAKRLDEIHGPAVGAANGDEPAPPQADDIHFKPGKPIKPTEEPAAPAAPPAEEPQRHVIYLAPEPVNVGVGIPSPGLDEFGEFTSSSPEELADFVSDCEKAGGMKGYVEPLVAAWTSPHGDPHGDVSDFHDLIDRYCAMPGNGTGGSLHIVLDDRNLERSCVLWCYSFALENGDTAGAALAGALLCLPDPLYKAALDERRGGEVGHG